MAISSTYFYPHNCPLQFTGTLTVKINPTVFTLTAGSGTTGYYTLTPAQAALFGVNLATTSLTIYRVSDGDYGGFSTTVTVTIVGDNYRVSMADISTFDNYAYFIEAVDDGKRWIQVQVNDTQNDAEYYRQNIEVACINYAWSYNANSLVLNYLKSPELIIDYNSGKETGNFDFSIEEDVVADFPQTMKNKSLVVSVFDFSTLTPMTAFVGYHSQGWQLNDEDISGSEQPLVLSPTNVYDWVYDGGSHQYYIWQGTRDSLQYTGIDGIDGTAVYGDAPVFKINYWLNNDGVIIFNEGYDIPAEFTPIGNLVTCPEPDSVNNGGAEPLANAGNIYPLLYNLNQNLSDGNFGAYKQTRYDISKPVLVWFNLMGGIEYQQLNTESHTNDSWYGTFGVRQQQGATYKDVNDVRREIANNDVVDTLALSIYWDRNNNQKGDRIQQLLVSKSVFIICASRTNNEGTTMRQLLPIRKPFVRQTGSTIGRTVAEFEFAQTTDIKR